MNRSGFHSSSAVVVEDQTAIGPGPCNSTATDPKITIVTAARNAAVTMGRMFDSVARQTLRDWHHVVVVNGSTDNTTVLARDRASGDPRIEVISADAGTAGAARNAGLGRARGGYVLFLDADDTIGPRHLAALLNIAQSSGAEAVAGGYRRLTPDGRLIVRHRPPVDLEGDAAALAAGPPTALHAILFRREAVEAVSGFDESLRTNEDWDLCRRIVQTGGQFAVSKTCSADYWTSPGSLTSDPAAMLRDMGTVAARFQTAAPEGLGDAEAQSETVNRAVAAVLWNGAAAIARNASPAAALETLRIIAPLPPAMVDIERAVAATLDGLVIGFACPYGALETRLSADDNSGWRRLAAFLSDLAETAHDDGLDAAVLRGLEGELARIGPAWPRRMIGQTLVRPVIGNAALGANAAHSPEQVILRTPFLRPRSLASMAVADDSLTERGAVAAVAARALSRLAEWPEGQGRHTTMRDRAARGLILGRRIARRVVGRKRSAAALEDPSPEDLQGENAWEDIFSHEDPWNYHRVYEQTKYDWTIELLPDRPFARALELACAEGLFTERLAPRVGALTAADISATALERAEQRCTAAGLNNVTYQQLDFFNKPMGSGWDLIVSSEVLYYMGSPEAVSAFAGRVAAALEPDGLFLHAHAYEVSDSPERSGFDWGDQFAAATISKAFQGEVGLVLERAIETELYRIELYRKAGSGSAERTPARVEQRSARDGLEPELAADVVWNGAVVTREAAETERRTRIPVLMYHSIGTGRPAALAPWQMSPEKFEHQLRFLRRRGYRSVTLEEWHEAREHSGAMSGRPILITFDDGFQDFADVAWPILKRNGFGAHVFVVTDRVGTASDWDAGYAPPAPLMDWDTLRRLADEGVTLGSHMHRHMALDRMSFADVARDAVRSRELIHANTGFVVNSVAPPYGICDPAREELILQAGYRWLFRAEGSHAPIVGPRGRVPRIDVTGGISISEFARLLGAGEPPTDADLP